MQRLIAGLILALLAFGSHARAQGFQPRKLPSPFLYVAGQAEIPVPSAHGFQPRKTPSRPLPASGIWAVNYEAAPVVEVIPEGAPAATAYPAGAIASGDCCKSCDVKSCGLKSCFADCPKLCKIADWICYRRATDCCKGCGCCYWCTPPLYSYFNCCREGAHHGTRHPQPCPPACKGCGHKGCKSCSHGHAVVEAPAAAAAPVTTVSHKTCGVR